MRSSRGVILSSISAHNSSGSGSGSVVEKISDQCLFGSCSCKHQILIVERVKKNYEFCFPTSSLHMLARGEAHSLKSFSNAQKLPVVQLEIFLAFYIWVWIRIRCKLLCFEAGSEALTIVQARLSFVLGSTQPYPYLRYTLYCAGLDTRLRPPQSTTTAASWRLT